MNELDNNVKKSDNKIKISVRTLVEFIFRQGDIVSTGTGVKNTEAMLLGSRLHRKIQKSMGPRYESEVSLATHFFIDDTTAIEPFSLVVEGRADGIFERNDIFYIDEIKGVYQDVTLMNEPAFVHKAQAMCYAYMLLTQDNLSQVGVQMTYCHLESETTRRFQEIFTKEEICDWFIDLIKQYKKWAIYEFNWQKKRNHSIQGLSFPFSYRPGQKELAAMTYHTIADKKKLFIEAPTGVGKTITTVFPAVKAIGEGLSDRIFYLTAKTITRTVAEDCFSLLASKNLSFKPVTITAKEKMCVLDKIACNPQDCPRAKGHYDRVNEAIYDMLTHEDKWSREILISYADTHNVCPFEMTLDAALFADAVICDYNYVFDPNVYLRRFFSDKKGDAILLIDEAHNLVERGREMYSARLVKEDFLTVKRIVKSLEPKEKRKEAAYHLRQFEKALEAANKTMLSWKRNCDTFSVLPDVGIFQFHLLRILAAYELFAKDYPILPERETMLNFFFDVRNFSAILDCLDDKYQIYTDYDTEKNFRVKLQCMDPSEKLFEVMEKVRSTILFSATLLPIRYYKEQLGGKENDNAVYATSSFSPSQRKLLIAKDVTSKYTRRSASEYKKIASYISAFVSAKNGNYMIFFPSYAFMENVLEHLELSKSFTVFAQSPDMTEREKESFLDAFQQTDASAISCDSQPEDHTISGVIGCCVMGGIFSEGIDLTEDRLIGAVIVGTGLPMVCHERELFKDYYEEKKGKGFDYAYLYPGVNKVFQAGGRVIRTAKDRGAILLLDERFLQKQYLDLFPREWFPYEVVNEAQMTESLRSFWK